MPRFLSHHALHFVHLMLIDHLDRFQTLRGYLRASVC